MEERALSHKRDQSRFSIGARMPVLEHLTINRPPDGRNSGRVLLSVLFRTAMTVALILSAAKTLQAAETLRLQPLPPTKAPSPIDRAEGGLDSGPSPSDAPLPAADDNASDENALSGDGGLVAELAEATAVNGATCQNEIWQIYTRHLPACTPHPTPRVYQHACQTWQTRNLEDLLKPFDGLVVIFAHGNRMEACNTLHRGMLYYRCLTSGAGPKVRFIIWSWPSDQVKGQIKDVRVKAERADCEGAYLGWFLEQLPEEQGVSLIGYSYGARVIANAMHLRTCGGNRYFKFERSDPMRVVINAPAMSNCDLASWGRYSGAMSQVDRMLMLYNSTDPILKRYRVVERGSRPSALGYTGLKMAVPGGPKIRQIDASPIVGRSHYEPKYLANGNLLAEMRRCLLWEAMP